MITINRDKVEVIVKQRLREQRKPLLDKLDLDFMRALELGLNTKEISETKQALRDITKIDLSQLSIQQLADLDITAAIAIQHPLEGVV